MPRITRLCAKPDLIKRKKDSEDKVAELACHKSACVPALPGGRTREKKLAVWRPPALDFPHLP